MIIKIKIIAKIYSSFDYFQYKNYPDKVKIELIEIKRPEPMPMRKGQQVAEPFRNWS